jgi:DHA1 family multidrug resistance protein-like MFS transporter
MADLVRETPLGRLIRLISGKRLLKYPDELPGFELPSAYTIGRNTFDKAKEPLDGVGRPDEIDTSSTQNNLKKGVKHQPSTGQSAEAVRLAKLAEDQRTSDRSIIVGWYNNNDPANPQNWSNGKRFAVSLIICLYTFVVYAGSAIYTSSEQGIAERFNVGPIAASLPLSLYVLAYGLGPLFWAPLSEIPIIGRSPVYATTMALFTIISLPTALVESFAGLLVLRFMQGLLGSPCLAIGAATLQDMYSPIYLPFAL